MDLDLSPTPTPTKSDDETEVETPPHTSSDSIKNHNSPPPSAAYKECMKNHAANIGGHAVDGCGEFMPGPSADSISLKCAACGCHRSFHRRDPESPTTAITPPFLDFRRPGLSPPRPTLMYSPHMLLSLSTPAAAVERHHDSMTPTANNPLGRKRFRTRFSQEQKEKMHSFSEKLGWKMHKSDEAAVEEFCREVGVAKGVLKVWIHNNKTTIGKKETAGVEDGLIRLEQSINGDGENGETRKNGSGNCGRAQNESGGGVHFHDSNNGSCSSR